MLVAGAGISRSGIPIHFAGRCQRCFINEVISNGDTTR
jgi:hypothetical protein